MTKPAEQLESKDFQEIEYPELGITLHCIINTDKEKILKNIKANISRDLPQIWPHKEQDTVLAICAGGPSLVDTLDELREVQERGGKVVALANAAHVLVENGIRPNCHVLLDAKPNNANFIIEGLDCTYLVASQCDPSVINTIMSFAHEMHKGNIFLWHAVNNDEEFEVIHEAYEKWIPVQAGATISLRALRLFNILGYSNFEMFGFDSCRMKGRHHAYEQPDADDQRVFTLGLNDHRFEVTPWMINQAMEFMKITKMFGQEWNMKVHGDGLIATMIKEGANIDLSQLEEN